MQVRFSHLDFVHGHLEDALSRFPFQEDDGDEWKGNTSFRGVILSSSSVPLPSPLLSSQVVFKGVAGHYTASFQLVAGASAQHTHIKGNLERAFGARYLPTKSSFGYGFLLRKAEDTRPLIGLAGAYNPEKDFLVYQAFLGDSGADALPISDFEAFQEEVGTLESVANVLVASLRVRSSRKHKNVLDSFANFTVDMHCL